MSTALNLDTAIPPAKCSDVQAVAPASEFRMTKLPPVTEVPSTLRKRLSVARERLRIAGENGIRVCVYEVALDLDMSEFHFARQFRAAYGCSPHVYYDEVRGARARDLKACGHSEGQVARLIGLRRPAELRALLVKRWRLSTMEQVMAVGDDFFPN
ncbi:MAG: AraC family transcriptional regulator [Myxococcales bacterium]|nr:AraC family transcriptional regulator [Myxococcales bacterium]